MIEYSGLARDRLESAVEVHQAFAGELGNVERVAEAIVNCLVADKKVLLCGNGGSAADAQHVTGELVGRYKLERRAYPAIALTTDTSILTAWGNDYDFETIFERQVEALGDEGDVLIGFSTSGNSENVYRALERGKRYGLTTVSFTGGNGGRIKDLTKFNVNVPSDDTPRIQECHMFAYHTICEIVEKAVTRYEKEI